MSSSLEVHQECSRDQLAVMIRQEETFYRCENFLSMEEEESPPVVGHCPLHIVAECAMLVTDVPPRGAQVPAPPTMSPLFGGAHHSNKLVRSPITVSRFPPPTSTSHTQGEVKGTTNNKGQWAFPPNFRSNMSRRADRTPPPQQQQLQPVEAAFLMEWRNQMLVWAYNVTDTYMLDREVVSVAFHLLDRYIASEVLSSAEAYTEAPIDREDFQLYAMVCMYIAIKTLVPVRKMTLGCIIEMSRGFYTEQHIVEAEMEILGALEWHVNQPTVMDFCRLYLDIFPSSSLDEDIICASCQSLAEKSLGDVYFISKPTSLVALATLLLTTQRCRISLQDTEGFLENLQGIVSVQSSDFDSLFRQLESLGS